jgi:hypothetical protein
MVLPRIPTPGMRKNCAAKNPCYFPAHMVQWRVPAMKRRHFKHAKYALILVPAILAAFYAIGQWRSSPSRFEAEWNVQPAFTNDVFTFVRIRYESRGSRRGWRGRGDWTTDMPDAELNLAYRLQQMTSLKVNPEGKRMDLTDPELFRHPFIYIVEPGDLYFFDEEVEILRNYLLNGGFLMVDDFWGERAWENFEYQMKRVFPDRDAREIPLDHQIFNIVFPIKQKPQIPNVGTGTDSEFTGITWEQWDAQTPHYRGIFDDKDRLMVIICHNTDLGDGWEREGENYYYFKEFSEKSAYPLGINIIVYAMTH